MISGVDNDFCHSVVLLIDREFQSHRHLGDNVMRFQELSLSFAAAVTLAIVPVSARAQGIVRDPCFGRWDYCSRRDDIERVQRDRAFEREARAEERARRMDDVRRERQINAQFRAEARADARAANAQLSEQRVRDREDRAMARREQAERNREVRIRTSRFRWQ